MSVLKEILEWSKGRPAWQRDALRRLVLNGELSNDDVHDLTEICKSAHGLADQQDVVPLAADHIPDQGTGLGRVTLLSIFHHRGVNALAEDQTLKFGPSLTAVYGDNAAGKTGYIRILKSACRARGTEEILGNVVSGAAPQKPAVAIKYEVGTDANIREWAGGGGDEFISRVSVFDSQCAAVYLTEKTDVAFRPFGLDLFDKLVKACRLVRSQLESEQSVLRSAAITAFQTPEGTSVARLLAGLSSLTKPDAVKALTLLSPEEESRLSLLERSLVDLQANDPEKLARQLTLRAGRVRSLARHLKDVEMALSADAVSGVFEVRKESGRKGEEAQRLRNATFPEGLFTGTGSERWSLLWESARQFSEELAYPGQAFPVVNNGARCVLCQQDLDHASGHRLRQFEAFVISKTEQELREVRGEFARLQKAFTDLKTANDTADEAVKEIRIEYESLADKISDFLAASEKRRLSVIEALSMGKESPSDLPALVAVSQETDALAEHLQERVKTLRSSSNEEQKKAMTTEVQELSSRKVLAKHEEQVLAEIERKKKVAAYELCLNDTKTHTITQKSSAVTKTSVTQRLKKSFQDELGRLSFRHVEVELKEVGGEQGILYHKLILTRAPGVDLPKVVSEGEQRCLSIAAFFAELSTADDPSGIVFDDPVSSLDYKWREGVARRLVEEAKTRQVIVFTHDIVFLLFLRQLSDELGVQQLDQHVRQLSKGSGVCAEELPWVALKVSMRIGHLKKLIQDAEKLHRDGHQSAYEREASVIYGYLREAWERGLEEVLLGGVVERYRPGVQTQQVTKIADISEEDCKALEAAMTKCSKWLPGHDQAAAARAEVPEPNVLKADIDALENWVSGIRKRRK
ncbi:AAA family ATPase [Candidatus Manganitrophus noduliformans]|uniref:AAA family ATPase n=1 Tax=Candidatus Manganitrophus noduliformans TaxID=2606439 RepID=A0A7X6DTF2_9BACT|nr:AAA family ATPase [Candidatus Manganitrophus noduliformans]NKE72844.1 AAA family ATPase [Candidatus Manganitrophus noduliformans]